MTMRNKAEKAQQTEARTELISERLSREQRKRLKDKEQRDIALSGGDDPLGKPNKSEQPGKFSDDVES